MTTTDYEQFKKKVQTKLTQYRSGLTWSEIRIKLKLSQKVPYNGWVKLLEKDIGLQRVKDARGIVWTLKERR